MIGTRPARREGGWRSKAWRGPGAGRPEPEGRPRRAWRGAALALAALTAAGAARAADPAAADLAPVWAVDPQASFLEISVGVADRRLTGRFEGWTAMLRYDPDAPETCHVEIRVDVASLRFNDPMADGGALGPDWLDAAAWPEAVYVSERFRKDAPGAWRIEGALSLRGVALPLPLDAGVKVEGAQARASVSAVIPRMAFGVGGEGMVDATVRLTAEIVARRLED